MGVQELPKALRDTDEILLVTMADGSSYEPHSGTWGANDDGWVGFDADVDGRPRHVIVNLANVASIVTAPL